MGNRSSGLSRRRQEVGEASDEDHVGLHSNGLQGLGKHGQLFTGQDLAAGHHGPVATVDRVHVPLDVGVAQQREDQGGRHHEEEPRPEPKAGARTCRKPEIGNVFTI